MTGGSGTAQAAVRVPVPGGVWSGPTRGKGERPVRELWLRGVTADDEFFVLDTAERALPSERATALLARCLNDGDAVAPALTIGDRDALLLHLRRLTIGDTFDCVLRCPSEACGEQMELALSVNELLVPPYPDARANYDVSVDDGGHRWDVAFRVPTAGDVDTAASQSSGDPVACADELLGLCVLQARRNGDPVGVGQLSDRVRSEVAAAMAEHDAQAEMELEAVCPACGTVFSALFDAGSFLLRELEERARRLLAEVHTLALHYHWSESDILGLSPTRRAWYLDLIARSHESRR